MSRYRACLSYPEAHERERSQEKTLINRVRRARSREDLGWAPRTAPPLRRAAGRPEDISRYVGRGTSPMNLRPRARYFLFLGTGAPDVFAELTPKGDAGTAGFFGCLGFLTSRLLRFWPLAIEVLLNGHVVRHL
jgi:hypothetical protein